MRDHAIDGTVSFLDLWAPFPRWINRHRRGREERCYSAKAISRFSADGLALAVEMSGSDGLIATYKCNIHEVRSRRKSWIVLSLLLVLWEQGRSERGSEAGEAMIRHLTSAVQDFGRSRSLVSQRRSRSCSSIPLGGALFVINEVTRFEVLINGLPGQLARSHSNRIKHAELRPPVAFVLPQGLAHRQRLSKQWVRSGASRLQSKVLL